MITPIIRKKGLFTDGNNLETILKLDSVPVFMGCTTAPADQDLKHHLIWDIDSESGGIQLKELIPIDILYPEAHNAGLIGSIWNKHHDDFAEFIKNFEPRSVLEIGGSHGVLCDKYSCYTEIPWTIIDINPVPNSESKAIFINEIFDENFNYEKDFDVLVHSHFLEHVYSPIEIMKKMSDMLSPNKKMIFSIPNMQSMLDKKYSNCLNFEHTYFLSEPYLEHLLSKYKLKILDKRYFMADHSIFYCVVKDSSIIELPVPNLYQENLKLFNSYVEHYNKMSVNLNKTIDKCNNNIYLFGAHIFSQNLIIFGMKTEKIKYVLDNDLCKHDKRLYGTNLIVKSPQILKNDYQPIVILQAGVYNEEIKKQILNDINPSTIFIMGSGKTPSPCGWG
jgi:hypothetical protein